MSTTHAMPMLRLLVIFSSLSIAMNRCSTRCDPSAPRPQPTVASRKTHVMGSFAASVSGFMKPGEPPTPVNGCAVAAMSVSGRMMKLTSITSDWNTSVRETAMKPPMNVYDTTAARVSSTLGLCSSPKIVSSSLAPAISPEFT